MVYEYWFAALKPLSDQKKKKLREACGTAKDIYYIEEIRLKSYDFLKDGDVEVICNAQKNKKIKEQYQKLEEKSIRFIPYFDRDYPEKLKRIPDFPYAVYVKGRTPGSGFSAAIVGARRCTHYGEAMALEYGRVLAQAGVQIISGMAKGIDGAGQRGALNGGGETYAVLGCGVDVCYPRGHIGLYMDIQKSGGIISEQCPGEPPLAGYFPRRNRIISALSDIILVMEAKERSGSLITVDFGLEQGKDIYALPGPADSPLSLGCHRLIRQGAGILLTPRELLEELNIQITKLCEEPDENKKVLETCAELVYSCLDLFPKGAGALLEETRLSPGQLFQALTSLEIKGLIKEVSKNYYIKVRK